MAFDIDDLQIQITAKSINAVQEISKLASSLRTLSKLELDSTKIAKFVNEVAELGKEGEGLKVVAVELTEIARALSKFKVPKEFNNIAQNVKGSVDPQDIMFAEAAPNLSKGGKQIDAFVESVTRLNEVGTNTEGLKNLADVLNRIAVASSSLKTLGKAAENTGKSFDHAARTGLLNFLRMVKRVAMMRAIRSAIRFLAQAVREGFEMFVTWDREQNNYMAGTAANVEKLSEKWNTLKGSIGALGGALANSLIPVINVVIDGLTKLVEILQQIVRSLQGEYTFYKMIYKAAKATTGQAKELRRVLFGFDELNILPSQSGSGGTSSSGSWVYEELPINSKFLNGIADISRWFQDLIGYSDDWRRALGLLIPVVGAFIGVKALGGLRGLLPSIISLFKGKNEALGKQTTATQAETSAVNALNGAYQTSGSRVLSLNGNLLTLISTLGLATSAAKVFQNQINNNPATQQINTAVDLSGLNALSVGVSVIQSLLLSNPLTIALTAPLNALLSAIANWRNQTQSFLNTNPLRLPIALGSGNASYYSTGSHASAFADPLLSYSPSSSSGRVTAADVEREIANAYQQYEQGSALWNNPLGKPIAAAGISAFIMALTSGAGFGSLGAILNALGLAGAFGLAGGGVVPNTGSLFYAGEAGAEVVANLGHSTGVMNVSQMQDAVANGNIEVVNAIYALANTVVNTVNNKSFDVYMDASKVGQSVSKYQFNQARRGITQGAY